MVKGEQEQRGKRFATNNQANTRSRVIDREAYFSNTGSHPASRGTRFAISSDRSSKSNSNRFATKQRTKTNLLSKWNDLSKLGKIITTVIALFLVGAIYGAFANLTTNESNDTSPPSNQLLQTESTTARQNQMGTASIPTDTKLRVHFIDVGQGDSTFIELPDGKTMLIDAGPNDAATKVSDYINALGHAKIDYLLASHPHEDHIGGMSTVISKFEIGEIWAVRAQHDTQTFEDFLDAVTAKNMTINTAETGKSIGSSAEYSIELLYPDASTSPSELNDWSAICLLKFGETSFLFPGDASATIVSEACTEDIDVLKVAHHGSETGTNSDLVDSLKPEYAVICCGADNNYGHPSAAALTALGGTTVYHTDLHATIVVESYGQNISFNTEKQPATDVDAGSDAVDDDSAVSGENIVVDQGASEGSSAGSSSSGNLGIVDAPTDNSASGDRIVYIGNTGDKYHLESCHTLKGNGHAITLQEALAQNREACKICKP